MKHSPVEIFNYLVSQGIKDYRQGRHESRLVSSEALDEEPGNFTESLKRSLSSSVNPVTVKLKMEEDLFNMTESPGK